jgi:hypothetical protein
MFISRKDDTLTPAARRVSASLESSQHRRLAFGFQSSVLLDSTTGRWLADGSKVTDPKGS